MIQKLGDFLTKECKRQNLTARELSARCHHQISADYISKIKNRQPKSVTIDILQHLSVGLGMSLKQLLEESGIIDSLNDNQLSKSEALHFFDSISDTLSKTMDIQHMTPEEKYEIANYVYELIRMVSYKYK